MKLAKRLMMRPQASGGGDAWTPAEITTTLWLDDSGEDGTDFNGSALHTTANIIVPYLCAVFIVLDTSSITTTQIALEHSSNYNSNAGSFLLSIGESANQLRFGFKRDYPGGSYFLRGYTISSGKLTLGLLHTGSTTLNVYNNGVELAGVDVNVSGTANPPQSGNLPLYIRGRAGNLFPLSGTVHEVIITPEVPSADICRKIDGYAAHKWDRILDESARVAALPSDHPYKSTAP